MNANRVFSIILRISAILGTVCAAVIVVLFILVTWKIPVHEYRSLVLQNNFRTATKTVHPTSSQLLAEIRKVGNWGNSNHCDYYVGQFRFSQLSKDTLTRAYAESVTPSFPGDPNGPLTIELFFTDDDYFKKQPWSDWLAEYLSKHPSAITMNMYFVLASSEGHDAVGTTGDLRCN